MRVNGILPLRLEDVSFAAGGRTIIERLNLTLVRKGAPALVAGSDGSVWINASGSSALATGGTGDVLTGLIGSLIAQGAEPMDAACVACFLHGRAGDRRGGPR